MQILSDVKTRINDIHELVKRVDDNNEKIKFLHNDVGSLLSFLKNKSSENLSKTVDEWDSQINAMLSKMYKNI